MIALRQLVGRRHGRVAILLIGLSLAGQRTWPTEITPVNKRSDYEFMSPATKAIQDDDSSNPGMFGVVDGEALWNRKDGSDQRSCADCHANAHESMRGLAARYPKFDTTRNRVMNLEARINVCRTEHQNATPFAFESKELLALAAFVANQSRGLPVNVAAEGPAKPSFDAGRALFERRQGQLNISCAQCHDDNWGRHLAGNIIPQAQPTGYPIYRLEWQGLGSLQRRLRNCLFGMRAAAYPYGASEYIELELFLAWRANGLKVETPAVRP
jgi:sulfur-oxidizing protein SoxA